MAGFRQTDFRTAITFLLLALVGLLLLFKTPPRALFTSDSRGDYENSSVRSTIALREGALVSRGGRFPSPSYPPTFTRCHHGDWSVHREEPFPEVQWKPRAGKFMIAACYDGGYSNRMMCITFLTHIAAMLGRRLVVLPWQGMIQPRQGGDIWIDFDLASVLDIDYMASCVETKDAALTWAAFKRDHPGMVTAEGLCFEANIAEPEKYGQPCVWGMEHGKQFLDLDVTFKGWVNVSSLLQEPELFAQLDQAGDPDVLWVLGTHNNCPAVETPEGVRPNWPYVPVARTCKGSFFQPTPGIMLAARRFVGSYMSSEFAAIHLRRNDFVDSITLDTPLDCRYGDIGCNVLSIPQLATCLERALEAKGLSLLFVATDASLDEFELLKELLLPAGKSVIRVPRFAEVHNHRWYQGLPPDDAMLYSMVEKTIAAMSTMFVSSFYSTFSQDIQRLRYDWGKDTCHDHQVCQLD